MGGNLKRHDDMDDDIGISTTARGKKEIDWQDIPIDIASEFDNFVHEVFETEPPLGKQHLDFSELMHRFNVVLFNCHIRALGV